MLTIDSAADLLATSPRTIRRYIADGRLPAYRLGPRQIRVKHDDVTGLLAPIPTA